uniref:HTH CENPB-type domain-containing protein n=1 Tax=Graphocephala atropunctata TaxID=36148 RepID=A0A1B6ML08_9HEMI
MYSKSQTSASKTAKRKHVTLTIHQKLDIIKRLEKSENRNNIIAEFNISSSTIYDIKKQKQQLEKFVSESASVKSLDIRQTLKKPKLETLDSALYKWFSAKRAEGKPVTGPMIIEKAKFFHTELGLPNDDMLSFSKGWLHNFKIRHGIRKLDVSGEIRSADEAAANEYKITFQNLINDHNLSPSQIYNADETGLLWRCLPNSTLAGAEESSAKGFKKNKDRLTVLVCGNASGDHRLIPFVIGKFKKPRPLKNITNLPVIYSAQSNAWMTADLFKDWFFCHFVPAVKENFEKLGLPQDSKAVLVLDNCRAHPKASDLVSGNIFCTYLPANVTPLIQPMDQGVIQNFKCMYRGMFIQRLLGSDCSVKEFQRQYNIKDAIFAAAVAWNNVKNETLHKAWRKLYPQLFAENQSEEGENEFSTEHSHILNSVNSDPNHPLSHLSNEEINEWMEVDKDLHTQEDLTDEVIIQSVLNPQEPLEESDSDAEAESTHITWKEASEALDKFVKFAESSRFYDTAEVMNLHIIKNSFCQKRAKSKKQIDIATMFRRAQKKTQFTPSSGDAGPSCSVPTTSTVFESMSIESDSD